MRKRYDMIFEDNLIVVKDAWEHDGAPGDTKKVWWGVE